jgi:hypothetical protein
VNATSREPRGQSRTLPSRAGRSTAQTPGTARLYRTGGGSKRPRSAISSASRTGSNPVARRNSRAMSPPSRPFTSMIRGPSGGQLDLGVDESAGDPKGTDRGVGGGRREQRVEPPSRAGVREWRFWPNTGRASWTGVPSVKGRWACLPSAARWSSPSTGNSCLPVREASSTVASARSAAEGWPPNSLTPRDTSFRLRCGVASFRTAASWRRGTFG